MEQFRERIIDLLAPHLELERSEIAALVEVPKHAAMGDYALPCFALARRRRKAPKLIASEVVDALGEPPGFLAGVEAAGPYVNFRIDPAALAAGLLPRILDEKERFGREERGGGRHVVIDYSSPNIAKPFGLGHLRSTVIGWSLKRIHEALGYRVVGINHLGDWGTQFGLMMAAWTRWGDEAERRDDRVQAFYDLYVRINTMAKEDPAIREEGQRWFVRLEEGDAEAVRLWRFFVDESMKEFQRIYEILGIEFEEVAGESVYLEKMAGVLRRIEEKGLARESEGAVGVDLSAYDLGFCMLKKSDGGTTYALRDLAALYDRGERFDPAFVIYVVGRQELHFQQVFKVVELMGEPWAAGLRYVDFGFYLGMATREGTLLFLDEVLRRAAARAEQEAKASRHHERVDLSAEELREVSRVVGAAAVKFFDLKARRRKDIDLSSEDGWDWERLLNPKGETGPYILFSYARLCGILRKHARPTTAAVDFALLGEPETRALLRALGEYPAAVRRAADELEPSIVADAVLAIAATVHAFVHKHRIIQSEEALRDARALLVECARQVLENGLGLLGIEALEKM